MTDGHQTNALPLSTKLGQRSDLQTYGDIAYCVLMLLSLCLYLCCIYPCTLLSAYVFLLCDLIKYDVDDDDDDLCLCVSLFACC